MSNEAAINERAFLDSLTSALSLDWAGTKRKDQSATEELQNQVEKALSLGEAVASSNTTTSKSLDRKTLALLQQKGINLSFEPSVKQSFHLKGLFQPASKRQIAILKHFKVPRSFRMNKTMANFHIKKIFSNSVQVEEWKKRPPTSRELQGLLFMNGQLSRGMTLHEAQRKLKKSGMENPAKYREWNRIEALFAAVNDQVTCQRNGIRKITWKRFFHFYDEIKNSGIEPNDISVNLMLTLVIKHQHGRVVTPYFNIADEQAIPAVSY
jgi:hypothetical protein